MRTGMRARSGFMPSIVTALALTVAAIFFTSPFLEAQG